MIRLFSIALAVLFSFGLANAAGLYPLSNMQQFDSNGKPLAGARLFIFDGGTSTPKIAYKDSSLTSPHPNPILADSSSRLPLIYLQDGFYRQRLTTKTGTQIFDQDGIPVISTTAAGSGTSVDPNSIFGTRDIKIRFDDQPLAGYVRLNGRTIGSASSGATERANADTEALFETLWTYTTITIVGGKGSTAVADFTANKQLKLPDAAGRGLFGMDDLGAGAASRITATTITNPTQPGSSGGAETVVIAKENFPIYSLTGAGVSFSASATTTTESGLHGHTVNADTGAMSANASHSHGVSGATLGGNVAGASSGSSSSAPLGSGVISINSANTDHTHHLTTVSGSQNAFHTHNVTVSGTTAAVSVASGGSATALNKMPPAILFMIYIRL